MIPKLTSSPPPQTPLGTKSGGKQQEAQLLLFLKKTNSVIYLHQVLAVALRIFSLCCGLWDLVPRPGIQPGPPPLGVQSLSHWTTWKVSRHSFLMSSLTIEDQLGICLQLT